MAGREGPPSARLARGCDVGVGRLAGLRRARIAGLVSIPVRVGSGGAFRVIRPPNGMNHEEATEQQQGCAEDLK
jgi:hypothetical protein